MMGNTEVTGKEQQEAIVVSLDNVRKKIQGGIYCKNCGIFIGSTCDPFSPSFHGECFEHLGDGEFKLN